MANLERQELRQILSHELAHLKRFDDWIILVQKIVSIVFSFHPAVLWIGKQMNLERELACDDSVIESGELPRSYALCLTRLAEFASTYAPPTTVSAGSQLSRRIDMLLNKKEIQHSAFLRVVQISGMSLILGCALWISQEGSLLAVSPEKENLVMSDPKNSFESAQQRFVEAKMRLEQAREEMLAAGEAMRNAQPESKARKEIERSIPETSSLPVLAPAAVMPPLPEAPSAPEAPPAVATPGEMKRPSAPPVPESLPSPALEAVPEAPPVPDVPPSLKVHNDRIK